jgi:hypothetical protein
MIAICSNLWRWVPGKVVEHGPKQLLVAGFPNGTWGWTSGKEGRKAHKLTESHRGIFATQALQR